jgi:hypothetical protein
MKWFGKSWGAVICEPSEQVPVPVGVECIFCKAPFIEESTGFAEDVNDDGALEYPSHVRCFMAACTPSPQRARSMQAAQQICMRAASFMKPPDQIKTEDVLQHLRQNHVRAMCEVTLGRPREAEKLLGIVRQIDEKQLISRVRAKEIAEACIVSTEEGKAQLLVEKLLALIADELDKAVTAEPS